EDPGLEPLQRLDPLLEVVVAAMQLLVGAALLGGEVPHRSRHVVDAAAQRVQGRGHAPLLLDDLEGGVGRHQRPRHRCMRVTNLASLIGAFGCGCWIWSPRSRYACCAQPGTFPPSSVKARWSMVTTSARVTGSFGRTSPEM